MTNDERRLCKIVALAVQALAEAECPLDAADGFHACKKALEEIAALCRPAAAAYEAARAALQEHPELAADVPAPRVVLGPTDLRGLPRLPD